MTEGRLQIMVEHRGFDWEMVNGMSLKAAAKFMQELAEMLPADAQVYGQWTEHEEMTVRVISYRDETDEEFAVRKEWEAEKARRDEEQRKRDETWVKKRAEYHRLKRELGL